MEHEPAQFRYAYADDLKIEEKIRAIARNVYGADNVDFTAEALEDLKTIEQLGFNHLPVCMAKTQYSLSDNPKLLACPENFRITVRGLTVAAGAGFVVALCGAMMRMPGLPSIPAAHTIDVDDAGVIQGLF